MTTMYEEEEKCAICGEISKHIKISSTNAFGSSDLDTRPPEMQRSTIKYGIQTCPKCAYCNENISNLIEGASEIIQKDFYQQQFNSDEYPKIANAFLCSSIIKEQGDFNASAGWDSVQAAWICDDDNNENAGKKCRKRAVALFQKAKEKGQKFTYQNGAEEVLLVDLLRRSGDFELALKICEKGLKNKLEKLFLDILEFEKILIYKRDMGCYTVNDAIN